ncbi:hypothetical protein [Rubripirellula lacrimiformis]|uniref:hypothetical protein n=1 Tax=Rubripirellula lacrimiformis TaxID=1930273 RepID=UPI001C54E4C1|nr:hypothetical protein [Rubripirellula lacrimiformis]
MAASTMGAGPLGLESACAAGDAGRTVMLRPTGRHDLYRVRVELEVEGNVNVPKNPLVSRKSDMQLPITSTATMDYEERVLGEDPSLVGAGRIRAAQRYYHVAKSERTLNRTQKDSQLRDSVRETVVRRDVMPEVVYAVDDYFDRDELELLRLPASSLGMDDLLPTTAVSTGSKYSPSSDAMLSVLGLSSVDATEVVGEVVEITPDQAKIQFTGNVHGSVEGVPTMIRTVGKLTFDRKLGASTWLAMAVHETREIGKAEPGFDVSATIKMLRKPLDKPIALAAKATTSVANGPIPEERLYVDLKSNELGLGVLMDRRWRMMTDVPGAAMMRMIEDDRSIAQCDFRPLASLPAGTQWTLEAFQEDIRKTLGEQLADLVSAEERASETGLRVLRVTATGAVEGVPIQWMLMHLSDDSGRRVLATFTMEAKNSATFAGSDHQLGASLRLLERRSPKPEAVTKSTAADRPTRIARANQRDSNQVEVQSASDLK